MKQRIDQRCKINCDLFDRVSEVMEGFITVQFGCSQWEERAKIALGALYR